MRVVTMEAVKSMAGLPAATSGNETISAMMSF